ncbi:hypothetical protein SPI_08482 [Niveomyces insectorum RCEF 264]|uniref:Uncharacterized protein n=1 Tax=Niveomyces insectorum RCEF 264 TaxID=1081102 RepID=A0A167N0C1_9HYPO|nr:hypothetical protein SPI_08482 [Niveomyces insectorum RCEF 264]
MAPSSSSRPVADSDRITLDEFREALARYPAVIQAVSDIKGAKTGQPTLAELDTFRYQDAPARFGLTADAAPLGPDDVKTLVTWKLRHGKFRPTLMKLVASNNPEAVRTVVQEALTVYKKSLTAAADGASSFSSSSSSLISAAPSPAAAIAAVRVLCLLRGIGPATASLLLAVHDPERVVFFGDEVYAWLCGGAAHLPPKKYNEREYEDVSRRAAALQARLNKSGDGGGDVRAVDIEKVAFVLLKQDSKPAETAPPPPQVKTEKARPAKRKKPPTEVQPAATGSVRRSKRVRHT